MTATGWQSPCEQLDSPLPQLWPHAPQFEPDVAMLTHWPPQTWVGAPQSGVTTPGPPSEAESAVARASCGASASSVPASLAEGAPDPRASLSGFSGASLGAAASVVPESPGSGTS